MSKYLSTERDITSEIDEALQRIDWNVVDDKIGMIELCQGRDEDGLDWSMQWLRRRDQYEL